MSDDEKTIDDLTVIQSELNAPKNQNNSFGGYAYRNAEDIQSALKPLLLKHECKLSISDSIEMVGNRIYVLATVTFTDSIGEITICKAFAREGEDRKGMTCDQLTGCASSYARKYALGGLLLIDDQKDSDSMDNKSGANKKGNNTQQSSSKKSGADAVECPNEYLRTEYIEENWNGKLYSNNTIYFNNTKFFVSDEWVVWFKNHPKFKPQAK